jgi:hypothetical protein
MKNKILVIVPSRSAGTGREQNVERFIQHWLYFTEGHSDLCISLDEDDQHHYERYQGVIYTVNPNERLVPKLNTASLRFIAEYEYIAFFGDDHIIKSAWESEMISHFESTGGVGIAYGNDLLQGERLPTAVCMTSNIIQQLGYMIPPVLLHMYADNFWVDLGKATECIQYFPDIIWEHCHPDNGKAQRDAQYAYAANVSYQDQHAYHEYINNGLFQSDIKKINNLKQIKNNETSII